MTDFRVGDLVAWSSVSGGSETTKAGEVVGICPKGMHPVVHIPKDDVLLRRMFDGLMPATSTRYIIKVQRTPRSAPVLYCPRTKGLRRVE